MFMLEKDRWTPDLHVQTSASKYRLTTGNNEARLSFEPSEFWSDNTVGKGLIRSYDGQYLVKLPYEVSTIGPGWSWQRNMATTFTIKPEGNTAVHIKGISESQIFKVVAA